MRIMQCWIHQRQGIIELHTLCGRKIPVDQRHEVHRLCRRQVQWIRIIRMHKLRDRLLREIVWRLELHRMFGWNHSTEEWILVLCFMRGGSLPVLDGPDELRRL